MTDLVPPVVPWDPQELQGRECGSCACYFEMINADDPSKRQGFCRRQPAQFAKMRVMEPRLDRDKKPVIRDGQVVMQPNDREGFVYPVATKNGTCFDGWRPKGTLPGETLGERFGRTAAGPLLKLLEKAPPEAADVVRSVCRINPQGLE